MEKFKNKIRKKILDIGFDSVGFAKPTVDLKTSTEFKNFLNKNYQGEMKWLEKHYEKKKNPKKIWEEVKTIIVVGLNYAPQDNPLKINNFKEKANISVYAKNKDYHVIIKNKLKEFKDWFDREFKLDCKIFVDTAPVMEKYFAKETGVGWQGKHTNIVSKKFGSWLFLSEIFLPIKLENDKPSTDNCGSCNDCITICPTDALVKDSKIDARKCISYLTIEYKGPIPMSLREKIGNKVYGCDDCLSVCPWNKFSEPTKNKNFLTLEKEKDLKFFLDFDGNVLPCCWLGNSLNRRSEPWLKDTLRYADNMMNWYNPKVMNAIDNDLTDLLLESIWMKQLQKSWDIAPCKTCARFCSKRINIKKQVNREML